MSAKKKSMEGGEVSPLAPASSSSASLPPVVASATPHEGLPEGWRVCRIEDITERLIIGPFGSRMKSDTYTNYGVPVIRGTNITGGRSFSGEWVFVSTELANELKNCKVESNDLVFPHRGAIGEVGIVPQGSEYILSSSLMSCRCNDRISDPLYLYYFFKSTVGRFELLKNSSQVGTPGIGQPLSSLRAIEVPLPPLFQQKKIAAILSSLDDKIELNRAMNETLESIAQALFKSWFVDFDPVRARAAGEKPVGMDDATAPLFPDSFVDSELGPIPKGWEEKRLDNFFELAYGKALKSSDRFDGEYPVYGSGGITGFHNEPLVNGPGIIIGRKGSIGTLYWEEKDFFPIDTVFYIVPKPSVSLEFLYYLLQTLPLSNMNTDAAVPGLNRNNVYRLTFINPPLALISSFMKKVIIFREIIHQNTLQTKQMELIRDSLLPKLLSGEISVASIGGDAK